MNLLHFKYAVEIAKTGSISKAAENLYMGQPNLSRAIRELEKSLGITIFRRNVKGVSVTPEGEEFLVYAKRIMAQLEHIERLYINERTRKERFSVCVPRASYISRAFCELCCDRADEKGIEFSYQETNCMETIENVAGGEYNLGIIRYQSSFKTYFERIFSDKRLSYERISEFPCVLLIGRNHRLAQKDDIDPQELSKDIQISFADPYLPSFPQGDKQTAEGLPYASRKIFVCDRLSRFELLSKVEGSFMWTSPISDELLDRYSLVQKSCSKNRKIYADVLIYRKSYRLSPTDMDFIEKVKAARDVYLKPYLK